MEDELLPIDLEIAENSIIKVMGVGGGGCNAVNYLYRTGVEGVSSDAILSNVSVSLLSAFKLFVLF